MNLERTARARAVEDRNQEFKSDRADVREMEGSLERLRGDIAEVVRKLAVYVRARLERSRGRSGPVVADPIGVEPIMANALDRVKAAEAKYAAMAGTAEKLEATLKKLKGTAQTCQWSIDQLHRSVEKDKASDRAAIVMFVLMAVIVVVSEASSEIFYGRLPCESSMLLGAWWGS